METIKIEKGYSRNFKKGRLKSQPGTIEEPVDLEPYIDFLQEIEAFEHSPPKKALNRPFESEFELVW